MSPKPKVLSLAIALSLSQLSYANTCPTQGSWLQVLGSGGPEIADKRASSSYLIWRNGQAQVLVDVGGGSMLRFEESGARVKDLQAITFTHFHIDHSADFPALLKASFFDARDQDLPVFGPMGNHTLPSTEDFVQRLLNNWMYMSGYLTDNDRYQIIPQSFDNNSNKVKQIWKNQDIKIKGIGVDHGALPAVAWRIEIGEKSVTFSGDMSGKRGNLEKLAANTDLLIAHNAIPEQARGVARLLHMPPSKIGEIAAKAKAKNLILSHRMIRSLETTQETTSEIKKYFTGPLNFANDLDCFEIK